MPGLILVAGSITVKIVISKYFSDGLIFCFKFYDPVYGYTFNHHIHSFPCTLFILLKIHPAPLHIYALIEVFCLLPEKGEAGSGIK